MMTESSREHSQFGRTHLYYGPGKGKTTAAMGLLLRFLGHGYSAKILQFLKGQEGNQYGELSYLQAVDRVDIEQFSTAHYTPDRTFTEEEMATLQTGLERATEVVETAEEDLILLDELSLLWAFGVCDADQLVKVCTAVPGSVELIITGRKAPDSLVESVDYATRMEEVSHPYQDSVPPREGVEW